MELFTHTPGHEHPEIIEMEGTAFVRELLVEGEPDGRLDGGDRRGDQPRHHAGGRRDPASRPPAPGPLPPGRGHRPLQREHHEHAYGPATTIKTVEKWAFGPKVGEFSPEQAAKHVLAVPGADHFLEGGVHVGSLVIPGSCRVVLDLLPRSRFEG